VEEDLDGLFVGILRIEVEALRDDIN